MLYWKSVFEELISPLVLSWTRYLGVQVRIKSVFSLGSGLLLSINYYMQNCVVQCEAFGLGRETAD